jgi:hypothetical protein
MSSSMASVPRVASVRRNTFEVFVGVRQVASLLFDIDSLRGAPSTCQILESSHCQHRPLPIAMATAEFASSRALQSASALLPLRPDFRVFPLVRYAPGAASLSAQCSLQLVRSHCARLVRALFATPLANSKSLPKKVHAA